MHRPLPCTNLLSHAEDPVHLLMDRLGVLPEVEERPETAEERFDEVVEQVLHTFLTLLRLNRPELPSSICYSPLLAHCPVILAVAASFDASKHCLNVTIITMRASRAFTRAY